MIARGLGEDLTKALSRICSAVNMRDGLVFGGVAMVSYGVSLVSPPAAWVVAGLAFFWLGVR